MTKKTLMMLVTCGLLSSHILVAQTSDVTGLIKGQVKGNIVTVAVNNDTQDGDPAVGAHKRLKVDYTVDNVPASIVVLESGTLTIKVPEGKTLTINKAVYGDLPEKIMDVTDKLTSAIRSNKLSIEATNDTLGGDPCEGANKELRVTYTVGTTTHNAVVHESETLRLPLITDGAGDLAIVKADYGVF